jgi:hypothetical protein
MKATGSAGGPDAIEIPRRDYVRRLAEIVDLPIAFGKQLEAQNHPNSQPRVGRHRPDAASHKKRKGATAGLDQQCEPSTRLPYRSRFPDGRAADRAVAWPKPCRYIANSFNTTTCRAIATS